MKLKKSSLAMILAVVLTLTMAVGGTLAYLTDTDAKVNEFTMGDVDIELDEDYVQDSVLMPGDDVLKTASIKNVGKNEAYAIMSIAVPAVDGKAVVEPNLNTAGWTEKVTVEEFMIDNEEYLLYVYMYNDILPAGGVTSQLLNSITLDKRIDYNPVTGKYAIVENGAATDIDTNLTAGKVYVNAYAIQTTGFASNDEAYNAYVGQWGAWNEDQIKAGSVEIPGVGGGEGDEPPTVVEALTAADFEAAVKAAGEAGAGNTVINLATNAKYDMTGFDTPVNVNGYNGADVVTINGNGSTLTNLSVPLFEGGFAGGSGIVIKDLTIKDSNIVSTNTQGSGAFIETIDSMDTITLNNCHLIDSTVKGSRTGGLIGWSAGYSNTNDGAVYLTTTIKDCSVEGCTIENTFSDEGATPHTESLGAIIGHAGANDWTQTNITNCVVKNNTLIGGNGKTGVILGTANTGDVVITGCTMEGNTVNGSPSDKAYGRTAFGSTGSLTIDGTAIN